MSLDEESVVLEERRKEMGEMIGRCFHGEIQTRALRFPDLPIKKKKMGR